MKNWIYKVLGCWIYEVLGCWSCEEFHCGDGLDTSHQASNWLNPSMLLSFQHDEGKEWMLLVYHHHGIFALTLLQSRSM